MRVIIFQISPYLQHLKNRYLIIGLSIILIFFVVFGGIVNYLQAQETANTLKFPLYDIDPTPSITVQNGQIISNDSIVSFAGFKMCVVGDNNLGTMPDYINEGLDPYQFMHEKLADCDFTVANLETNISTPGLGTRQDKSYAFNAPLQSVGLLRGAGVDIVSLANNHTMDYGPVAFMDEINHLTSNGVFYFGGGSNLTEAFTPKYVIINGTKLAFLAFNDIENHITNAGVSRAGSAYFNESLIRQAIQEADKNADIVIVYPHWGSENSTVINSRQQYYARVFIDSGADLVVGSGPHVRQAADTYNDVPIFYSLGNFVVSGFAGWDEGSTGRVLEVQIEDKKVKSTSTYDVEIVYHGFPKIPGSPE